MPRGTLIRRISQRSEGGSVSRPCHFPLFDGFQRVPFRLLLLVKWAQMVQTFIIGTVEEFQTLFFVHLNADYLL